MDINNHCNRRTLKRRIRRIVSLCIFITILFFTITIIYLGAAFFKSNTSMISGFFSRYIAQSMCSQQFPSQIGLGSLKELKSDNKQFQEWIGSIKANSSDPALNSLPGNVPEQGGNPMENHIKISLNGSDADISAPIPSGPGLPAPRFLFGGGDFINMIITVNSNIIYADGDVNGNEVVNNIDRFANGSFVKSYARYMLSYFNCSSIVSTTDGNGNTIQVSAKLNDGYILLLGMTFSAGILFAAFLALVAGFFISRIFTIPVTIPLYKLDERIKAIAAGSNDSAMTSQIQLKKPLREIESLADSTNQIMVKMREINELLIAQNEELEAQNEELFNSKKQVEEAQTLLIQSENMASVGQLTAAITHEINTPLGAIHSNAQIFDMLLDTLVNSDLKDQEFKDMIIQMKEANDISLMASNRVSQIIKSLKNFSRVDQAEFQESDINEGIRSVLVLTSNLWKRKITIHEEYGELPLVKCFPGMLNQVIMNIVVNAIQAIGERGDIFIKTWNDEGSVYMSIKDNGCGISEENIKRIFDNGFTTKSGSQGMGLGLAISRSIINKHNGEIKVSSKVGEGTEFIIVLPLKAEIAGDDAASQAAVNLQ